MIGLSRRMSHEHKLELERRPATLTYLIENLEAELDVALESPPIPPEAQRGYQGMLLANEMLKHREAHGVLIGGLMLSLLKGENLEKLNHHKDVDVLIIDKEETPPVGQWEAGIDWWWTANKPTNPNTKYLSRPQSTVGDGVRLIYDIELKNKKLPPGLYFLDGQSFELLLQHESLSWFSKSLSKWARTMAPEIKKIPLPTAKLDDIIIKRFVDPKKLDIYRKTGYKNFKKDGQMIINIMDKEEALKSDSEMSIPQDELTEIALAGFTKKELSEIMGNYPIEALKGQKIQQKAQATYARKLLAIGEFEPALRTFEKEKISMPKDYAVDYLERWRGIKPKECIKVIHYLRKTYNYPLEVCIENLDGITSQYAEIFGDAPEGKEELEGMILLLEGLKEQKTILENELKAAAHEGDTAKVVEAAKTIYSEYHIREIAKLCLGRDPYSYENDSEDSRGFDFRVSFEILRGLYPNDLTEYLESDRDRETKDALHYLLKENEGDGMTFLNLREFENLKQYLLKTPTDEEGNLVHRRDDDYSNLIYYLKNRIEYILNREEVNKSDKVAVKKVLEEVASQFLKNKNYLPAMRIYEDYIKDAAAAEKINNFLSLRNNKD